MIITRTPFRISFLGGGTDYPAWYEKNRGAVLSTTINRYCYLSSRFLPPFFKHNYRVVYSKQEMTKKVDEINHPSVRETIKFLNLDKSGRGLEIHHNGDLPAMSGMGSSASFTVGLLNALSALNGEIKTKRELALESIHIDQKMTGENVGSQDHTAASFGGLNKIEFGGPQTISISPIASTQERLENFQDRLMLFFTDFPREASKIAKGWIKNTNQNEKNLYTMLAMVDEGAKILSNGNRNLDEFGQLLDNTWKIKRALAPKITNNRIDEIYQEGRRAGAIGGKILGAGGGGFILFYADPKKQPKIKERLKKFLHVPFKFEHLGSQIVYYSHPTNI